MEEIVVEGVVELGSRQNNLGTYNERQHAFD